jgi:protein involved in ribonucleotide reduction
MLLVYASQTGNVQRFIDRLPSLARLHIRTGEESVHEPCVLVTYTSGFGAVPPEVQRFLSRHASTVRGVAASGNRNWGANFARSADTIAAMLGVPVLHRFELAGNATDAARLLEEVHALARA